VAEVMVVGIVVTTAIITDITTTEVLGSGAAFGVRIGVPRTGRVTGAVIGDPAGDIGAHPPSRTRSTKSRGCGLNVILLQPLPHRLRLRVTMQTRSSGGIGVSVAPSITPTSRAAQKAGSAWRRKRHRRNDADASLAVRSI
jgi:hypothetical protein